ncbi:type II secretion system protein [Ruminococcus flavefaciens]|uniref:type II secretion system protein n=1 Tax=Ruminococcus flavefaciens TaxID=1265 RepID=UPI0004677F07|nr:type II secretion system protein [Ruminococcus flavefaciens]
MKSKRKGFTLVELIIVLTIIGILSAIVIPSWGYFMRRSRERTANSKAKVVFNAAQTEITRTAQRERTTVNVSDPVYHSDTTVKDNANKSLYVGTGDFYFYWDGDKQSGYSIDKNGNSTATTKKNENTKFANAVNNICGTEGTYKIYVHNYAVQSVVYSTKSNGQYKGTYPKLMGADQLSDATEKDIRSHSVETISLADMKGIALP